MSQAVLRRQGPAVDGAARGGADLRQLYVAPPQAIAVDGGCRRYRPLPRIAPSLQN